VAKLEKEVTVIFSSYDVVSPIPDFCKSDLNKCYFVEKFVRISKLELICERQGEIACYLPTFFKFTITII
jgi:hypothetical protein